MRETTRRTRAGLLAALVALLMIVAAVPASADGDYDIENITWESSGGGESAQNVTWE